MTKRPLWATHMPYCVYRLSGPDRWVLLNRSYKPLGMITRDHVDYEPHAIELRLCSEAIGAIAGGRIVSDDSATAARGTFFLYSDANNPGRGTAEMAAYVARVAMLMGKECAPRRLSDGVPDGLQ